MRSTRVRLITLALAALSLLAFHSPPAYAQRMSGGNGWETRMEYARVNFRTTTAGTTVPLKSWIAQPNYSGSYGYLDSTVYRRGPATRTVYDTTVALQNNFAFPPCIGTSVQNAVLDSCGLPWLMLKWSQDTTSYSFAGTSGGAADTVRFAIEHSEDGVNWLSCSGTPTQRFDAVFMTSGQDGLQSPTIFGVEASPGEDVVYVPIRCIPARASSNTVIVTQSLCAIGGWFRIIVGGAYSGQYKLEIGSWQQTN